MDRTPKEPEMMPTARFDELIKRMRGIYAGAHAEINTSLVVNGLKDIEAWHEREMERARND